MLTVKFRERWVRTSPKIYTQYFTYIRLKQKILMIHNIKSAKKWDIVWPFLFFWGNTAEHRTKAYQHTSWLWSSQLQALQRRDSCAVQGTQVPKAVLSWEQRCLHALTLSESKRKKTCPFWLHWCEQTNDRIYPGTEVLICSKCAAWQSRHLWQHKPVILSE